jgi:hypothetical protein
MTKSENIRALAKKGIATADIAKRLGIRYQHAYNVLKRSNDQVARPAARADAKPVISRAHTKPPLSINELINCGFEHSGDWVSSETGQLSVNRPLPKGVGVYAFAIRGEVVYIGVATMGLAKRLYFYAKPGVTQRTSKRLNETIKQQLAMAETIEIYTAMPSDLEWNGLPVHGSAGLELGLIKKFALPWNKRSSG